MKEPSFVADPNHRKKTFKKDMHKLLLSTKEKNKTITACDILRIGANYAHMMRQMKGKDIDEMTRAAESALEHHFDCHVYCGALCRHKNQTSAQRAASSRYY